MQCRTVYADGCACAQEAESASTPEPKQRPPAEEAQDESPDTCSPVPRRFAVMVRPILTGRVRVVFKNIDHNRLTGLPTPSIKTLSAGHHGAAP